MWYNNKHIKIDIDSVFFEKFSEKGMNFLLELFDENVVITNGAYEGTSLTESNMYFQYIQLVKVISNSWKSKNQQMNSITERLNGSNHQIIKGSRIMTAEKIQNNGKRF